jgi:hypothetical protein
MAFTFAGAYDHAVFNPANSKLLKGISFDILELDMVTPAVIYDDRLRSNIMPNPVTTDPEGNLHFFTEPGFYLMKRVGSAMSTAEQFVVYPDPAEAGDDFWLVASRDFGVSPLETPANNRLFLQNAVDGAVAEEKPLIVDGDFQINDEILPDDDLTVVLTAGCVIRMTVADKTIFRCVQKDNITIIWDGGRLFGEGGSPDYWDQTKTAPPRWTGNSGHDDRGVQLLGCTNCTLVRPWIQNMANAGIYGAGGSGNRILFPRIQGTNDFAGSGGTPLPIDANPLNVNPNFQNGILIENDAVYGDYDDWLIVSYDISGTAQGILTGEVVGTAGTLKVVDGHMHDIPGQHGFYIASSRVSLSGEQTCTDCALAAVKVQANAGAPVIEDVSLGIVKARNCGSQAIDIEGLDGGQVRRVTGVLVEVTNCLRGLALVGDVVECTFDTVDVDTTTQSGLIATSVDVDPTAGETWRGPKEIEIGTFISRRAGQNGMRIASGEAGTIRVGRLIVREPDRTPGNFYGVLTERVQTIPGIVENALHLDVGTLDLEELAGNVDSMLFHSSGTMAVRDRVRIIGGTTQAVRADAVITEWPEDVEIVPAGAGLAYNTKTNIRFSRRTKWRVQSVSAANVFLWRQTLEDESSYGITAEITGKLAGSAQRARIRSAVEVHRDGAGAVLEGSDIGESTISNTFAGVYSWLASGNEIQLLVNSGAAATTYDWEAAITMTKRVG